MSNKKDFTKVESSDSPRRVDMPRQLDSKSQPAKLSEREREGQGYGNYNGDAHDFNNAAKVTNNRGSDYHDTGRGNSGLHGNFAEKDASIEYLRNRNKDGQEVQHYSGTGLNSKLKIGGGQTAYDSMPIPEVYKPATRQGAVPANPIMYKNEIKDHNSKYSHEVDTESNQLEQRMAAHLKSKGK